MRQAENKVYIEGILSEVDLKEGSFDRDGKPVDYISGTIKVRVAQEINSIMTDLEIPVHIFATKLTKRGSENPAYTSAKNVMNDFVSIAAAGGEQGADRIRITNGDITQNDYYDQNGNLQSYPKIRASFVNKIKASDCKPKATFNIELVVAAADFETDREGVETGRYVVKGIVPQYGDRVDVISFIGASKGVVDAISNYWTVGETYKATGKLNFSSTSTVTYEEVDFGEPIEKVITRNVSELIITGGSQTPLEGDYAYDQREIETALAERKARIEKEKDKKKPTGNGNKVGFADLGF